MLIIWELAGGKEKSDYNWSLWDLEKQITYPGSHNQVAANPLVLNLCLVTVKPDFYLFA